MIELGKPLVPAPTERVAFVGKMHSGKTTVSNMMQKMGYRRVAFADPVKDVAAAMLNTFAGWMERRGVYVPYNGFDRELINQLKGDPTFRKFLQWVGTELGRDWTGDKDIWIKQFMYDVEDFPCPIVNDDTRFPNEAEALKEMGFTVVKLIRDEEERRDSIKASLRAQNPGWSEIDADAALATMLSHPSETEVENIVPHLVYENTSLDSLEYLARSICGQQQQNAGFGNVRVGRHVWDGDQHGANAA